MSISGRDLLVLEYQKYVEHLVAKLARRMNLPSSQLDEFISAGNLGLVEAAERFDPANGTDFRAYAFLRIRGAVIDTIRRISSLSGKAYRLARALEAAHDLREQQESQRLLGKPVAVDPEADQRLAAILDCVAKGALAFRLSYFDWEGQAQHGERRQLTPHEELEKSEARQHLKEVVRTLPARERQLIEDYYFNGKSFKEIGKGPPAISKSWVSKIHARAIDRLRKQLLRERHREDRAAC